MSYLFFSSMGSSDHIKQPLVNRLNSLVGGGLTVASLNGTNIYVASLAKAIQKAKRVFIWNGTEMGCFWVKAVCKRFKVPYTIIERGLYPQREDNYITDKSGVGVHSMLGVTSLEEDYNFTRGKTFEDVREVIENLKKERGFERKEPISKKVAFIFQLEHDSTVYHAKEFDSYDELIDEYREKHNVPKENIVACPHPKHPNPKTSYRISTKGTLAECEDAEIAVGISSTVLYELYSFGVPVEVLAGACHPLFEMMQDEKSEEVIVAQILEKQFSLSDSDETIKQKLCL